MPADTGAAARDRPWGLRRMRAPMGRRDAANNPSETEPKGKPDEDRRNRRNRPDRVETRRAAGHDPLGAAPATGVDIITGKGLAEALADAHVVVDVSNAPTWGDAEVMDFFQTSARTILAAETAAGIGHHVALSVVGTERLQGSGYFRAK